MSWTSAPLRRSIVVATCIALSACGDDSATDAGVDAGIQDGAVDQDAALGPDFLPRLQSVAEFQSLAGEGQEVKYMLQVDGQEPVIEHVCAFQNTARFPYHLHFLRAVFPAYADLDPGSYASLVLRRASRRSFAGSLTSHALTSHPRTGLRGIYTYNIYQDPGPGEGLTLAEIVQVDQRMKACAPFAADQIVHLPEGAEREAAVRNMLPELQAAGVDVRFLDELIDENYVAYSVGENYGYLHVIPEGQAVADDYGPLDVLVLQSPPNALTTVAGLISTLPSAKKRSPTCSSRMPLKTNASPPSITGSSTSSRRKMSSRSRRRH